MSRVSTIMHAFWQPKGLRQDAVSCTWRTATCGSYGKPIISVNFTGNITKRMPEVLVARPEQEYPMTVTDTFLENNAGYAAGFTKGDLPLPPAKKVAVVACMDARLDPARVLGLEEGDAHVIRNAGGVVTDDAIRSLTISQRLLGTEAIVLIHHTDCGMLTFSDGDVKQQIEADTGIRPHFALEAFPDLEADVRQSVARIKASPFIPRTDDVRGFVYEVETGRLREVIA
jgi:carbonic anhydrase